MCVICMLVGGAGVVVFALAGSVSMLVAKRMTFQTCKKGKGCQWRACEIKGLKGGGIRWVIVETLLWPNLEKKR